MGIQPYYLLSWKTIYLFGEVMANGYGMGLGNRAFPFGFGGRGRMPGGLAKGPLGECVCPNCGHRQAHGIGVPCYQVKCPTCGFYMTRVRD